MITTISDTKYWTWDEADFTWDDAPKENVTWDELFWAIFDAVEDELIRFDESKNIFMNMQHNLRLGLTDSTLRGIDLVKKNDISITDEQHRTVSSKRVFSTNMHVASEASNIAQYVRSFAEKAWAVLDDEEHTAVFKRMISEPVLYVTEKYQNHQKAIRLVMEQLKAEDQREHTSYFSRTETETIHAKEHVPKTIDQMLTDVVKFAEEFDSLITQILLLKEVMNVADRRKSNANKNLHDQVSVTDSEAIKHWFHYIRLLNDSITLRDKQQSALHWVREMADKFSLQDDAESKHKALRTLQEALQLLDDTERKRALNLAEMINTYDALLENANAILSDITLFTGEMNEKTFRNRVNTPPGYSMFTDFYVGDYEYKKAIVRLILTTADMNGTPNIFNVVHNVDIPDTDDKGSVEITDTTAPTKVYFNVHYYHPPEVSITLKGGNTGSGVLSPNIVSLEGKDTIGRYFEVELLTTAGERSTGSITWTAKGY